MTAPAQTSMLSSLLLTLGGPVKSIDEEDDPAVALPLVLYVEDDPTNVEVTRAHLEKDYTLLHAATDVEACAMLAKHGASLSAIILDIQLQGSKLNGIDLCNLIRGRFPRGEPHLKRVPVLLETPIFFMSAYGDRHGSAIQAAGATGFVAKPVAFQAFSLALARAHLRGLDSLLPVRSSKARGSAR